MLQSSAEITFDPDNSLIQCQGSWTVLAIASVLKKITSVPQFLESKISISFEGLTHFDSSGALALAGLMEQLKKAKHEVELNQLSEQQQELLELVQSKKEFLHYKEPNLPKENLFYKVGKESENKWLQVDGLIILIGDLSSKIFEAFGQWRRFQWPSIISNIESAGVKALPIVALLSFLIGVVLAYQMGLQLEAYGANIFIAYLSGMAIFREFAPLITAIIVAGRTSSAFTAQIGSMKVNEEVDALLTMGLSPTELLVLPKVIGLLLIFPLLIFWADLFSLAGAMLMSKFMLSVGYADFLQRLKESVGVTQLMLGLYKAPAFALLIALVGCFQGFKVEARADSIGSQTTKSVVQALFLIIIADAAFSVAYSWMGL